MEAARLGWTDLELTLRVQLPYKGLGLVLRAPPQLCECVSMEGDRVLNGLPPPDRPFLALVRNSSSNAITSSHRFEAICSRSSDKDGAFGHLGLDLHTHSCPAIVFFTPLGVPPSAAPPHAGHSLAHGKHPRTISLAPR